MAHDETRDRPHIELVPIIVPTAEELHGWGLVRRRKMTREELLAEYPKPEEK